MLQNILRIEYYFSFSCHYLKLIYCWTVEVVRYSLYHALCGIGLQNLSFAFVDIGKFFLLKIFESNWKSSKYQIFSYSIKVSFCGGDSTVDIEFYWNHRARWRFLTVLCVDWKIWMNSGAVAIWVLISFMVVHGSSRFKIHREVHSYNTKIKWKELQRHNQGQ